VKKRSGGGKAGKKRGIVRNLNPQRRPAFKARKRKIRDLIHKLGLPWKKKKIIRVETKNRSHPEFTGGLTIQIAGGGDTSLAREKRKKKKKNAN